jgi:hypothetical protein
VAKQLRVHGEHKTYRPESPNKLLVPGKKGEKKQTLLATEQITSIVEHNFGAL